MEDRTVVLPLNPMPDGTSRTIKNQYSKNSLPNFIATGSWGASGVIQIIKIGDAKKTSRKGLT